MVVSLTAKEHGATFRVVRARRPHHCDDRHPFHPHVCSGTVKPGERYVRAVMFPDHDVYSYVDKTGRPLRRPIVSTLCFGCASGYHTTGLLVIAADREDQTK